MIIRSKRSQSRLKGDEHRKFQTLIDDLQSENKSLRMQLLQLEQRFLQSQSAKKKYKAKYKDAKQKLQILTMVGQHYPRNNDPYQLCMSPKTKTTRIRTISQEEFQSLRAAFGQSEFNSQGETKVQPQNDAYPTHSTSKRCVTAASTMKEIEPEGKAEEGARIMEHLLQLQTQLQALSMRIEGRCNGESRVVRLQEQLYRRMEEVAQKVGKMQVRDIEREQRWLSHQKEKSARKFNSSMKAVERIGKDLLGFKVDNDQ